MSVRAKFRCLGVDHRWDELRLVDLGPIYKDDGAPENAYFFEATPSGSCDVKTGPECIFKPNIPFYIDFQMLDEDHARPEVALESQAILSLNHVTDHGSQLEVLLSAHYISHPTDKDERGYAKSSPGLRSVEIKMGIDNAEAWPHFKGRVGSKWLVTFTEAPSDG